MLINHGILQRRKHKSCLQSGRSQGLSLNHTGMAGTSLLKLLPDISHDTQISRNVEWRAELEHIAVIWHISVPKVVSAIARSLPHQIIFCSVESIA